jgi:hypothetical protein
VRNAAAASQAWAGKDEGEEKTPLRVTERTRRRPRL